MQSIIGKFFRFVKKENRGVLPEEYIDEIQGILKDIVDGYPGKKGELACDILKTDTPDKRGTKSAKQLNLYVKGRRTFYDIGLLHHIAAYLGKTVATLLVEIELKIASKKK